MALEILVYLLRRKPGIRIDDKSLDMDPNAEKLFLYLADTASERYSREELSSLLYGSNDAARDKLRKKALFLLPPELKDCITRKTEGADLEYDASKVSVDTHEFMRRSTALLAQSTSFDDEDAAEAQDILSLYQQHFWHTYSSKSTGALSNPEFTNWLISRRQELADKRHALFDQLVGFYLVQKNDLNEAKRYAEAWLASDDGQTLPLQYLIWIAAMQRQNEPLRKYLDRLKRVEQPQETIIGLTAKEWIDILRNNRPLSLQLLRLDGGSSRHVTTFASRTELIGREDVINQLMDFLTIGTPRIFALTGQHGSGKSLVAKSVVEAIQLHYPRINIVQLQLENDLNLESLLNLCLEQLQHRELSARNIVEKRRSVRQLLQLPHHCVIIDGHNTRHLNNQKTRNSIIDLFKGAQIMLIAEDVGGCDYYSIKLPPFNATQTRALLITQLPQLDKHNVSDIYERFTELTGGIPLLLNCIGKYLRKEPVRFNKLLASFLALHDESKRVELRQGSYDTVLSWLWDSMLADERALLGALSLFALDEGATFEALNRTGAPLVAPNLQRQYMNVFVEMGVVELRQSHDTDRYRLYQLLYQFIRNHNAVGSKRSAFLPKLEVAYIQYMFEQAKTHARKPEELNGYKHSLFGALEIAIASAKHQWAQEEAAELLSTWYPYLERQGFTQAASDLITQAIEFIPHDSEPYIHLLQRAGQAAYSLSNYTMARDYSEAALESAIEQQRIELYASIAFDLGLAYLQRQQYEEAQMNFERAEEWAEPSTSQLLLVRIRLNLALRAFRENQFETAEKQYRKVIVQIEGNNLAALPDYRGLLQLAYNGLSITLTEQGRLDESAQYYERNLALAKELNNFERLGYVNLNLGVNYYFLKNYTAAQHCFRHAHYYGKRIENAELVTQIIINQGTLAAVQDKPRHALRLLNLALLQVDRYGLSRLMPFALTALGQAYLKQHWIPKAQTYFVEVLQNSATTYKQSARALIGLCLCIVMPISGAGNLSPTVAYTLISDGLSSIWIHDSTNITGLTRAELKKAHDYFQHYFAEHPNLARYHIIEAIERWIAER